MKHNDGCTDKSFAVNLPVARDLGELSGWKLWEDQEGKFNSLVCTQPTAITILSWMFASASSSTTQVTELPSSSLNFYCCPSYLTPFWVPKHVPGCQLSWVTAVYHHLKDLLSHWTQTEQNTTTSLSQTLQAWELLKNRSPKENPLQQEVQFKFCP